LGKGNRASLQMVLSSQDWRGKKTFTYRGQEKKDEKALVRAVPLGYGKEEWRSKPKNFLGNCTLPGGPRHRATKRATISSCTGPTKKKGKKNIPGGRNRLEINCATVPQKKKEHSQTENLYKQESPPGSKK